MEENYDWPLDCSGCTTNSVQITVIFSWMTAWLFRANVSCVFHVLHKSKEHSRSVFSRCPWLPSKTKLVVDNPNGQLVDHLFGVSEDLTQYLKIHRRCSSKWYDMPVQFPGGYYIVCLSPSEFSWKKSCMTLDAWNMFVETLNLNDGNDGINIRIYRRFQLVQDFFHQRDIPSFMKPKFGMLAHPAEEWRLQW